VNIDQKFIENYLTLKDDDPVLFKLFPWQEQMIKEMIAARKAGKIFWVHYPPRRHNHTALLLELQRQWRQTFPLEYEEALSEEKKHSFYLNFVNSLLNLAHSIGLGFHEEPVPMGTKSKYSIVMSTCPEIDRKAVKQWADWMGSEPTENPACKFVEVIGAGDPYDPEFWRQAKP